MKPMVNFGPEYQRVQKTKAWLNDFVRQIPPLPKPKFAFDLPQDLRRLRMAAILDPFSELCFSNECDVLNLDVHSWKSELYNFRPNLLLVESAWEGKNGGWAKKISNRSEEFISLVHECQDLQIPIAFWNKEDPLHFEKFLWAAKLCDYVFTADVDSIFRYSYELGHDRVFLLHFAASPRYHNPIQIMNRKNGFMFAGAYYPSFSERNKNLDMLLDLASNFGNLDIFDRNSNNPNTDHVFPEKFRSQIIGSLAPTQMVDAYKGYRYGLTVNTITNSQTMFARRVFEQIASNMITVGTYSRAAHNILGDLVVASDEESELEKKLSFFSDNLYYEKFRLAGLRQIMTYHTYEHRLRFLVNKVFNANYKTVSPEVTVISRTGNLDELNIVLSMFRNQDYGNKNLIIIFDEEGIEKKLLSENKPNERFIPWRRAKSAKLTDVVTTEYVVYFNPGDYYGKNYLVDMALALNYSNIECITKKSCFIIDDNDEVVRDSEEQYHVVNGIDLSSSLIRKSNLGNIHIPEYLGLKDEGLDITALAIDAYNFCKNGSTKTCTIVDDLSDLNTGVSLEQINRLVEKRKNAHSQKYQRITKILNELTPDNNKGVKLTSNPDGSMHIESDLTSDVHYYYKFKNKMSASSLSNSNQFQVRIDTRNYKNIDIRFAFVFFTENMEKISSAFPRNDAITELEFHPNTKYVWPWLRVAGKGNTDLVGILIGESIGGNNIWISNTSHLVVTNNYPSYDNLYRNAFVHLRMIEYEKNGISSEVFCLKGNKTERYFEFNGVDVIEGNKGLLKVLLESHNYRVISVHFLHPVMWSVLKNYLDDLKVVIFIHGFEIQQWFRRPFNYTNEEERAKYQSDCEFRNAMWRDVLGNINENVHLVFVSDTFYKEIVTDFNVQIPESRYSIIHNFIDTNLFEYHEKPIEQRYKILSIRPYESRAYGNDLAVKTILRLKDHPLFGQMEFRLIGNGALFEETLEPLSGIPNVTIERKFLRQEEIASLHREYGIFLVPSRMGSQGVSRDEAMSSGLVPITNAVGAIPEFVDNDCGVVAEPEDFEGMANGIIKLIDDSKLFSLLSKNAADRVRNLSSEEFTIKKEIKLLEPDEQANVRPSLSIIIPVYNVEKYLKRCLDSIVSQKFQEFECIVVDDGSTDGSGSIADQYGVEFPSVFRIIHKSNAGQGSARNVGLRMARGKYVGFVDSDDWIENDMYEKMMSCAVISNSDIVVCNYEFVYPDGNKKKAEGYKDLSYGSKNANLLMSGTSGVPNKIFKRSLLKNRYFDEDIISEDFRFTTVSIVKAKSVDFVDDVLYHYYRREDSTLESLKTFSERNYDLFTTYQRVLSDVADVDGAVKEALLDRMVLNAFNWRIADIHKIAGLEEGRGYALQWAKGLNSTIPGWSLRTPVVNWEGKDERLRAIVTCYVDEDMGVNFDELINQKSTE